MASDQVSDSILYEALQDIGHCSPGTSKCPEKVTSIEMVFRPILSIQQVSMFVNLTDLLIIGSNLETMNGIEHLPNLIDLWVAECNIKEIGYLTNCSNLKRLYLYDNEIEEIKGLENCLHLETLLLSGNNISSIQGIDHLIYLKQLNLADNSITRIGNSLQKNIRLESLNLSGNKIYFFRDIFSLMLLPKLKILSFAHPQNHCNPISNICNYVTCVIYHFTKLRALDGHVLEEQDVLKELESVCMKKLYYSMKANAIRWQQAEAQKSLDKIYEQLKTNILNEIRKTVFNLKEAERLERLYQYLTSKTSLSDDSIKTVLSRCNNRNAEILSNHEQYEKTQTELMDHLQSWNLREMKCTQHYKAALEILKQDANEEIQMLFMEHETLGSVRVINGSIGDKWFSLCRDLLLARFCINQYRRYRISGVRMKKCAKIINQPLRLRFQTKINKILGDRPESNIDKEKKYLFLMQTETQNYTKIESALAIMEYGVQIVNENELKPHRIALANNLYHADKWRLNQNECVEKKTKGRLIIVQTFFDTYIKIHNYDAKSSKDVLNNQNSVTEPIAITHIHLGSNGQPVISCSCELKSYEYYLSDPEIIIPEFIIDFEYISEIFHQKSPFILTKQNDVWNFTPDLFVHSFMNYCNDLAKHQTFEFKHSECTEHKQLCVTWDDIIHLTCNTTLTHLTELNLHGYQIQSFPPLSPLESMTKLILSFNCLTSLTGIAYLNNLEILDVSFNSLRSLSGLQAVPKLQYLDVSFNALSKLMEVVQHLELQVSTIITLNIHHNPIDESSNVNLVLKNALANLAYLNGNDVRNNDSRLSNISNTFRLDLKTLNPYISTSRHPHPSLSLCSTPSKLLNFGKSFTQLEATVLWYTKITSINLSNQCLENLNGVGKMENLKWACFSNNHIVSLQSLRHCKHLEELYMNNNILTSLSGIEHLKELIRLNVDHNHIEKLTTFKFVPLPLQSFSANFNCISSLNGLEHCSSLTELNLISNRISGLSTLLPTKSLHLLLILMLSGNPVCECKDYRSTLLFNVPGLLGLDGTVVERNEVVFAKDLLGGRLTLDFLADHFKTDNFAQLTHIELTHCGLQTVNLGDGLTLPHLRSLNLEENLLTSFNGLTDIHHLKVLCLNLNHIECLRPTTKTRRLGHSQGGDSNATPDNVLQGLEVLHLAYNDISNLEPLQIQKFPSLKALFLQGNKICSLNGMQDLWSLEHLVLDRNEISTIEKGQLESFCWLQELHIQENRLKTLPPLQGPRALQRLFLGFNRIKELEELFKLSKLSSLEEVSFVGNPVTRRALHRMILIHFTPKLSAVDGIRVSWDEKAKANVYFSVGTRLDNESAEPTTPLFSDETINSELHLSTNKPADERYILSDFLPQVNNLRVVAHRYWKNKKSKKSSSSFGQNNMQ